MGILLQRASEASQLSSWTARTQETGCAASIPFWQSEITGACQILLPAGMHLEAGLQVVHAAPGDEGVGGVAGQLHHLCWAVPDVHDQRNSSLCAPHMSDNMVTAVQLAGCSEIQALSWQANVFT